MKKIFFLVFVISSCTKEVKTDLPVNEEISGISKQTGSIPDQISFIQPGLYPEGVAFDKLSNRFLVSSLATGNIGSVNFDGTYSLLVQDADMPPTLGLKVDEARKQIVVVGGDLSGSSAKMGLYDLQSGTRIQLIDLSSLRPNAVHLADDVCIDPQGNKYVTDTKVPIIYKVDPAGHATIFFESDRYAEPPGFPFFWSGFNGIDYDRNGFLIVAFYAGGLLIKIPVNNPNDFSEINLDVPIVSPDGILLSRDGKELVVVDNRYLGEDAEITHYISDDNWISAIRTETFPTGQVSPTTATSDGKNVFAIYSYIQDLFFGSDAPQERFIIKKIPFTLKSF